MDGLTSDELWVKLRQLASTFDERPPLFFGADDAVLGASDRRRELEPDFRFLLPDADAVRTLMDKTEFARFAADNGFRVPQTLVVRSACDWTHAIDEGPFPCVIKPRYRTAAWETAGLPKVFVAPTREKLRQLRDSLSGTETAFVVQEWIPGPDSNIVFHLAYYNSSGTEVVGFTGRKLRQWPVRVGYTSAAEPLDDDEVAEFATTVLTRAGLKGLGSVEFKRDARDGSLVIMEPTVGRVNAQSELATANGVNIAHVAYCDLTGEELPPIERQLKRTRFFFFAADARAFVAARRTRDLSLREYLASYRGPRYFGDVCRRDPVPFLVQLSQALLRRVRRPRHACFGDGARVPESPTSALAALK